MITDSDARRVAGDWHGGQFTGLYAYASSGSLWLWNNQCHACGAYDTRTEVLRCLTETSDTDEKLELQSLHMHLTLAADRAALVHTCDESEDDVSTCGEHDGTVWPCPTCDICDVSQCATEGEPWNGDTGNHVACERKVGQ